VLAEEHGLRVIAPDPPGHGQSSTPPGEAFRPSELARTAAALLAGLGLERAAFLGFSFGGRVGCSFAALFPELTAALALVEGGFYLAPSIDGDEAADLEACIDAARAELEEESFASWDDFLAFERESLGRWTPPLVDAHRAVMSERDGRVVPILGVEELGAIKHGQRREPVTETYPPIAAAGIPVLLVFAPKPDGEDNGISRFREALPDAQIEAIPDAIHDLVSFAPERIAELVGGFVSSAAEASRE
jgi:pimeloyl-ACP methyl ester carboxylesterase